MSTVREATFDVLRHFGLTTMFANPGSTEVAFLTNLPDDFAFILALHEGSVVGAATGYALGRDQCALAILHTTAGLGNAVGAIATARVNRAPLVIIVGQQDRRHLALEPFLAGQLRGLAGEYPVWVNEPVRAQDVPGAIARAYHEALAQRGPALVIVPMDDWLADAAPGPFGAPMRVIPGDGGSTTGAAELGVMLNEARSPAIVVGAGADDAATWREIGVLAERIGAPVFQESFGGRAGFAQDHPSFAGFLPADRPRLRELLQPYDVVLAIGAPVFRQYPFAEGPLVEDGTRLAVLTREPAEAHRSPVELAVLGEPAAVLAQLNDAVTPRGATATTTLVPSAPARDGVLRAAHVMYELGVRLPPDAVVIEESPSSRPELHALIPARSNLGFLSAAMGGLGFALPAAIGVKLALADRPVVAVVGDGSSLYNIQALWTAAQYHVGALFIVLANGRYAIMDRLAERIPDGKAPWPGVESIDVAGLATALSCPSQVVHDFAELDAALDELLPTLRERRAPMLLQVNVVPDLTFNP